MRYNNFKTTVSKEKLLETLQANRKKHEEMFEEARDGYIKKAKELIDQKLAALSKGEATNLKFNISPPELHLREYDTAITMVQWHQGDTIELDAQDFSNFVNDDWDWLHMWLQSNRSYSPSVTEYAERKGL